MPKKVRIPTPLRKLTNNKEQVEVNAGTIGKAIGSPLRALAAWQAGVARVILTA